jgi:hypothetical protein
MHRSGTSAITGLFANSGYFVGDESQLMDPDWGNPAGYYERLDMLSVNETVMDVLGGNWIDPPEPQRQRIAAEKATGPLVAAFERLLAEACSRPVAVKDPRITALMPLWGPVISRRLHPVLVVRDPLEIAASLAARGGTPVPLSLASWEIHTATVLEALRGEAVTIARYSEIMRSPDLARFVVLAAGEHIDPRLVGAVRVSDGKDWLRSDLHHRRLEGAPHEDHLTVHQYRIWQFLDSLPSGTVALAPPQDTIRVSTAARVAARAERARLADVKAHEEITHQLEHASARLRRCQERLDSERERARPGDPIRPRDQGGIASG